MPHWSLETPIIVLSGQDDRELALRAVHDGAQDYLFKGKFDNELLARSIRYSIDRHWQIARRVEVERLLRAEELLYRTLVLATAQIIWTTNPAGEVVKDQPTWRNYTGQSEAHIMGRGWLEAIHPQDRNQAVSKWLG